MSEKGSRRSFILKSAAAGAASLVAGAGSGAAQKKSQGKMKVGVFGLDYSFWSLWADLLNPEGEICRNKPFQYGNESRLG